MTTLRTRLEHGLALGALGFSLSANALGQPPPGPGSADAPAAPPPGAASAPLAQAPSTEAAAAPGGPTPPLSEASTTQGLPAVDFQVIERGPQEPWILQIDNQGPSPVQLTADPRLLWFEVYVPGVKAPRVCRLPKPLWPEFAVREARLVLPPGHGFRRAFDPRFFCYAPVTQSVLVPGARVLPRFGWPGPGVAPSKDGTRGEPSLSSEPPFVAAASPALEAAAPPDADAGGPSPEWVETSTGIKLLEASELVLGPGYSAWVEAPVVEGDSPLVLEAVDGSDAEDERSATLELVLRNRSKRSVPVFVRSELLSYRIVGPTGEFQCQADPLAPPSDVTSFTVLGAGRSLRLVERMIELCPRGRLSRPGLYVVHATFRTPYSGEELGVDAFTGELTTPRPVLVRLRDGDRPFFIDRSRAYDDAEPSGVPMPASAGGAGDESDANFDEPADDGASEDGSPHGDEPPPSEPSD